MENTNNPVNLDDAIGAMKGMQPSAEQAQTAQARVLAQLKQEAPAASGRLRTSDDYSSLLGPYLRNELSEAQKMLVADRLASNPAYRRELDILQGKVREIAPARRRPSPLASFVPWAVAAGVLFGIGYLTLDSVDRLMAPSGPRAEIASVSGEIFKVSAAGLEPMKPGTPLGENQAVRTAKGSSAIVRLPDGSLIEMNERAELSISAAYSGSTVRLERGNILVQAAKQKRGALKVATRESTVSVKGTIFSVASGLRGTQVAVVEGHVVVDQGGKTEDLLPGQATGSETNLKWTTVAEQVAWSKDSARYYAMLGEVAKISKQIEALPMPALRSSSKLLPLLPADTVVYVAIPNVSATVADATKIFEDRLRESPVLQEWWKTKEVSEMRVMAEQLRSAGSQIGDEIVLAATSNGHGGPGEPFLIAEVKGEGARSSLDAQIKKFAGLQDAIDGIVLTDRYFVAGDAKRVKAVRESGLSESGFANTALAATVQKSYAKGAGWILAVDLEQIFAQSVSKKSDEAQHMALAGINRMRHLIVERRDGIGRTGQSDTRASLNFSAPRTGVMGWLATPAPMPSLDFISPDATFAMSAVTKNARQMAEEFFGGVGKSAAIFGQVEQTLGINVIDDLAGPLGGEITMAIDGPLLPVPTYVFAVEVYDASRLNASLRKIAEAVNVKAKGMGVNVEFSEENTGGRVWYRIKASNAPVEMNFTYSGGYLVGAPNREAISKALQNRQTLLSLPRSQRFHELLPLDANVNASGVLYFNVAANLSGLADTLKKNLPEAQQQALGQLTANSGPVLICAYAEADSITVASTSGFFGLGLDTLLAAGRGTPILPQILSHAMGQKRMQ